MLIIKCFILDQDQSLHIQDAQLRLYLWNEVNLQDILTINIMHSISS